MRLAKDFSLTAFGWKLGASVAPGWLSVGVFWEVSPVSVGFHIPFLHLWAGQREYDPSREPWQWFWSLVRLTIWKTELRLDLDLNYWSIGLSCVDLADFSIQLGPFNVQIETDKNFDEDFPPGVPTLRLFFAPGHSIRPWPPRCRCCPPKDRLQCDDVTDFADDLPQGSQPSDRCTRKWHSVIWPAS